MKVKTAIFKVKVNKPIVVMLFERPTLPTSGGQNHSKFQDVSPECLLFHFRKKYFFPKKHFFSPRKLLTATLSSRHYTEVNKRW